MPLVTHDVAIGSRLHDGTWSIECECHETFTGHESAAWHAYENHAGPWTGARR